MRTWFSPLTAQLRDRDDGAGGGSGSDTIRVDPGAPHEVGIEHEPEDRGAPKKTQAEIDLEDTRTQLATERRRREEAEEDSRYWAQRNRRAAADTDEPAPARRTPEPAAAAATEMTAEELVEVINKEGIAGLKRAGFLTKTELDQSLAAAKEELTGFVRGERADAEFGGRVASEFPTIAQESAKIARAKAQGVRYTPTDPLFLRAGELYREAIADDPSLENSQGIILATARMAQRELGAKPSRGRGADDDADRDRAAPRRDGDGKFVSRTEETPARRRDRIERQRPDRGNADEETTGGNQDFTEEQRTVMDKLGVKPEKFVAHRDAAVRQETRRARR